MHLLLFLLGTIIGIIIFFSIIALILYHKVKKTTKELGFNDLKEFKDLIKQSEYENRYEHKNVSGMTSLMIPKIINDFPNFSENELYNKVETSLRSIFKSLQDMKLSNNNELVLIKDNIIKVIDDFNNNNIKVKYSDIKFHKHAIKDYKKDNGALNITVESSLEYYYEKAKDNNTIEIFKDYKKQTSYVTEFIYVYDPDKYNTNQKLISYNCPNCGAPVKLNSKVCHYCSSGLDNINLKSWYIISYKEN